MKLSGTRIAFNFSISIFIKEFYEKFFTFDLYNFFSFWNHSISSYTQAPHSLVYNLDWRIFICWSKHIFIWIFSKRNFWINWSWLYVKQYEI